MSIKVCDAHVYTTSLVFNAVTFMVLCSATQGPAARNTTAYICPASAKPLLTTPPPPLAWVAAKPTVQQKAQSFSKAPVTPLEKRRGVIVCIMDVRRRDRSIRIADCLGKSRRFPDQRSWLCIPIGGIFGQNWDI